ncbi:MAG: hypothetical protein IMZ73_08110 [Chloroflexi bacterium]|nr:hypothetical protein [Chloroflexota bacterium]
MGVMQQVMVGPGGEAVGLKLRNSVQVRRWMADLEMKRCPCIPTNVSGRPAYFVNKRQRNP